MVSDRKTQLKERAAEELRLLLLITAYLAAFFVAFLTYRDPRRRVPGTGIYGVAAPVKAPRIGKVRTY